MIKPFISPGYIYEKVPINVFLEIQDLAKKAKENSIEHNYALAGQIKEEYKIDVNDCPKIVNDYILLKVREYSEAFPAYLKKFCVNKTDSVITLNTMWCNYQRKTEFNPIHIHDGLFSFVFWVKIPFSLKDELEIESASKSNYPQGGSFQFHYTDSLGKIVNETLYPVESEFVLFPAQLNHSVYPFYTSDGYRVSISGNLCYNH